MGDRHIALLRGINVGRAKRIAMADLRDVVAALGYHDVQTLLNSGNVVFSGTTSTDVATAAQIETSLCKRLGIVARVTVLGLAELTSVIAHNPFGEIAHDPTRLLAVFLRENAGATSLEALGKQDWGREALAIGKGVAYLWCPSGVLAGRLWHAVDRTLRDAGTARNWATIQKLHALAGALPPAKPSARKKR